MGEGILKSLIERHGLSDRVEVRSAGTWTSAGLPASAFAVSAADRNDVKIETHRSTPLNPSLIREADLVLAMEPAHLEEVLTLVPEAESKSFVLPAFADPVDADPGGVEDPIGGSEEDYVETFMEIDHWLRVALPELLSRIKAAEER